MVFMSGFLSVFPVPIERAILSNVTLPESRGRANSLLNIIDDLGKGLGPFLLSVLISSLGRKTSFNLSLIGWLVGGTICFFMWCTLQNDELKIQEIIKSNLNDLNNNHEQKNNGGKVQIASNESYDN